MRTRTCRWDDSDTPAHDPGLWRMEADHAGKGEVRRKEGKKGIKGVPYLVRPGWNARLLS